MKRYFIYNVLLNISLILMFLSVVAAYQSSEYTVFGISLLIIGILGYLKYRLLKQVRQR
ncbi:DUF6358 family protein [Parapedobacter indicus]